MRLLAIDTSTEYLTLAVMDGNKVSGRIHKKAAMRHSSLLVPMVDKVLEKSGLKIKDIDGFCIGAGPGSFTGLRIGVATVKAMAYSLNKPIAAVPTLDAIAENAKRFKGAICPVLDARKNKVYACLYRSDGRKVRRISKYLLLPAEELAKKLDAYDKVLLLGNAIEQIYCLAGERQRQPWHPRAEVIGRIGLEYFRKRKFVKPDDLEPMYLYSKECDITGK